MPAVLDSELQAIKDALDKETGDGRDMDEARRLSQAYIKAHPEYFTDFVGMTDEELCNAATLFRAAGQEVSTWRLEAFVRAHLEPQDIGGTAQAQRVAVPGLTENTTAPSADAPAEKGKDA